MFCDCSDTMPVSENHKTDRETRLPSMSLPGGSMEPILPVTTEPVLPALSRNFGRFEKAQVMAAPPEAKLPYCSGQPQLIASGEW